MTRKASFESSLRDARVAVNQACSTAIDPHQGADGNRWHADFKDQLKAVAGLTSELLYTKTPKKKIGLRVALVLAKAAELMVFLEENESALSALPDSGNFDRKQQEWARIFGKRVYGLLLQFKVLAKF